MFQQRMTATILTIGVVFAPDVAFIKKSRADNLSDEDFHPVLPDFAVEIISPSDLKTPSRIREKLAIYQRIKIPLFWGIYPRRNEEDVYQNGVLVSTAGLSDMLNGSDILPGFTYDIVDLFDIEL